MKLELSPQRLRAMPVQLVWIDGGVLLVRGCTEVRISGDRAAESVQAVMATAGSGATRDEIREYFAAPDRPAVDSLIDFLVARRLLVPSPEGLPEPPAIESELEVFYWHFGARASEVAARLDRQRVVVVGVNAVSRQLVRALQATGASNLSVVDHGMLRNTRLFDAEGVLVPTEWPDELPRPLEYRRWSEELDVGALDCLVATADYGAAPCLREWNQFCVAQRRRFLPVVLDRMIGSVGPLVVPGETACYECLRARENANLEDARLARASEAGAFQRQAVTGFHPSMASVLGDLAAIELGKYFGGALPAKVGRLIEVNLLATTLRTRKVLKVPRCQVCSPANRRGETSTDKNVFMPGHQYGK